MGSLSIWHWVIVLVVVAMIFGTGRLRNVGKDLGGAVKGFRDGVRDGSAEAASSVRTDDAARDPNVVDVEVKTRS